MIRALYNAGSGMIMQQLSMDNIANNMANINTTGYKKTRTEFADALYSRLRGENAANRWGQVLPQPVDVGNGTRLAATLIDFSQGNLQQTGLELDLAIEGDGFFALRLPDGRIAYTRNGAFHRDAAGRVVSAQGYLLEPPLTVPAGAKGLTIAPDGTVTALLPGEDEPAVIGRITLYTFTNPAGMEKIGENLFVPTVNSGQATAGFPGAQGLGKLRQGYLEMANVNLAEEMVEVITAQRAYEINSRVVRTCDEMLGMANSLLRR